MTALGQILAGARVTAAMVQGVAPLAAYKGADETVSTGVGTLQNDDALLLPVQANATYMWMLWLVYEGGAQGASDLKTGWALPTGTTAEFMRFGTSTGGTAIFGIISNQTNTPTVGTAGSGSRLGALYGGTLATGGTAGTMQFQWCQNTGTATATTVHTGSVLAAWQL